MISRLYRRALLALKLRFSRKTRTSIASRWLRYGHQLMDDAEKMSPVPLDQPPNQRSEDE
jgi:hypothetical protein